MQMDNSTILPKSKIDQAAILKVVAVAIAAPRWIGAFAAAIGVDALSQYSMLAHAEALSGGAMAILEGFAIAYVLGKWRSLKNNSLQWWILLTFTFLLAITLPLGATPYLRIEQDKSTISLLFAEHRLMQIAWSILVAGVPVLIIMAVGYADSDASIEHSNEISHKHNSGMTNEYAIIEQEYITLPANGHIKHSYPCLACPKVFNSSQALGAHSRFCKKDK